MTTTDNVYISDHVFDALVERLVSAEPTGELPCLRSHLVNALVDAGIMPAGLQDDVETE